MAAAHMIRLMARFALVLTPLFAVIGVGAWSIAYANGDHPFMLVLSVPPLLPISTNSIYFDAYLVALDTGEVSPPLFAFVQHNKCSEIALSPDQRWFAARCEDLTGRPDVYIGQVGADSDRFVRLSNDADWEYALTWAADNRHLIYLRMVGGYSVRVTIDRLSGASEQIDTTERSQHWLWSPDRTRYLPIPPRTGAPLMEIFNADGSLARQLEIDLAWESLIGWMPDNQHVLARSSTDGRTGSRLILIDVNTGDSEVVAEFPSNLTCFSLTADGQIVCHRTTATLTQAIVLFDPVDQTMREVELSTPLFGVWFAYS